MNKLILVAVVLAATACTTVETTYAPDGRPAYTLNCSGQSLTWGDCLQKAGELCGARGYEVLERYGEQGSTFGGSQYGAVGGTVMSRGMVIACKK